jgi:hypothetical protein
MSLLNRLGFQSSSEKSDLGCLSSPNARNISSSGLTQITALIPLSRPTEGRIAIVTDAGRDAVDAAALKHAMGLQGGVQPVSDRGACRREMLLRTAKSCGPDASTPASSLAEACRPDRVQARLNPRDDGDNKPDHRGEPEVSR